GDRREEDVVERLLLVVLEQEVVDVRLADLARVARIDRAVLAAGLPHLLARLVAEHDVARVETDRLEVRAPERARRVEVQDARDADANIATLLPHFLRRALERTHDLLVAD